MKLVERIIGKLSYDQGYLVKPKAESVRSAELKKLVARTAGVVHVRIRPDFLTANMASEIAAKTAQLRAQLEVDGQIVVATEREYDEHFRRTVVTGRVTVVAGQVQPLGFRQAMLLLDRDPYCYAFEEVDAGAPAPKVAKSTAEALSNASADNASVLSELAALKRQLASERQQRIMLEAQLEAGVGGQGSGAGEADEVFEGEAKTEPETTQDAPAETPPKLPRPPRK